MNTELKNRIAALLTQDITVPTREEIEKRYPKRTLPEGAHVTRFCPSPTGFIHIGTIFTAQVCQYVARQSGGVYIVRIEDTDKKREVAGAKDLIGQQLGAFGVSPDEGLQADGQSLGEYGPYVQSERQDLYLAYALDLLERDRAYPCFATSDELEAAVKDQQSKKKRPGYYGQWALWRDRSDEDITAALDSEKPFVLRFRSEGSHERRMEFEDVLKGHMVVPENDLDVPLIKSDEHRLPTYHLAHVVDDYLMRATIITRGEEWLSSTPLHIELAQALDITPFTYAHMPVISIIDSTGGGKRKLSKRKDPEADVAYWVNLAYPMKSIKAYLLGLANSHFEEWYRAHTDVPLEEFEFSLQKLATSRSPLLDVKKLEDYAKDEIARLPQAQFNEEILRWSQEHDAELYAALERDATYAERVLAIERDGDKPRKDMSKWSDAPEQFSYFFDDLFAIRYQGAISEALESVSSDDQLAACKAFLETYDHVADKDVWFENMKRAAESTGYALDNKALKANPEQFKGGVADFAKIIRVKVTGKTRSPDLFTIMQIMGEDRVKKRLA